MSNANQQSKAELLATQLDAVPETGADPELIEQTAAELRHLQALNQELLASLSRLSFAAMCRDNTLGDPCRLIEVKAELQAANKQASDLISKQQEN